MILWKFYLKNFTSIRRDFKHTNACFVDWTTLWAALVSESLVVQSLVVHQIDAVDEYSDVNPIGIASHHCCQVFKVKQLS